MNIENNLLKYSFIRLLDLEFGIQVKETDIEKLELANACVEIYPSLEEFYNKTNWDKDNPEHCNLTYLQENKICRQIQGKIWYFSRIRWEEGLKNMEMDSGMN